MHKVLLIYPFNYSIICPKIKAFLTESKNKICMDFV